MAKTTLLLIRHGETDDNKNGVFQGQGGTGLNPRGRHQATRLSERLARAEACPVALYSSDLQRALETAEIIGRPLKLVPKPEPGLREVFLGGWEGLCRREVEARFPSEWASWQAGQDIPRGGGETYATLASRMAHAIKELVGAHAGRTVMVISHGAAIKTFAAAVLGIPLTHLHAFHAPSNTGVSVVEQYRDGKQRLMVYNDIAHLRDPVLDLLAGA